MNQAFHYNPTIRFYLVLLLSGIIFVLFSKVWDGTKEVDSSERDKAYSERIERLNNAEQYALIANTDGFYPCPHCVDQKFYLYKNEVWKYGVTINGKNGRYKDEFLRTNNVSYVIEFEGPVQKCLEEEARKIILYYQLPENMKRGETFRLIRPPGNSKDQ